MSGDEDDDLFPEVVAASDDDSDEQVGGVSPAPQFSLRSPNDPPRPTIPPTVAHPPPPPLPPPATAPTATLPDGWIAKSSSSRPGRTYYVNTHTRAVQWEVPKRAAERATRPPRRRGMHPSRVRVRHLLVKHRESRNPSSWKETAITRSREEALQLARDYLSRVEDSDDFEECFKALARQYSDCNSARHGGDMGFFERGKMHRAFEKASFVEYFFSLFFRFRLMKGELSNIVETSSGIHLIFRVE